LPADQIIFERAQAELARFLGPQGSTAQALTVELIDRLEARGELATEVESRRTYRGHRSLARNNRLEPVFGIEDIPAPPPPPQDYFNRVIEEVRTRRRLEQGEAIGETPPISLDAEDVVLPTAFYMTLSKLQGENIPGEARIPLDAIRLAPDFWGWPSEYQRTESPREGQNRVYWNWRPHWRVWSVETPDQVFTQEVRMYMYDNSSDFRFYARPLVNAGGNIGDIVRIRRISQADAEYECVLARQGTPEFEQWLQYCTQPVRNSSRTFGYS
jgi:hypothetical protein